MAENNSEEKLTFLLSLYRNLHHTLPYNKFTPMAPPSTKFSRPNLSKCFSPFLSQTDTVWTSLQSYNISCFMFSLWPHEYLPRRPFCLLEATGVEQAHATHHARMGTSSFPGRCWAPPGRCPLKIKKSQLTPETRDSAAAGVRAVTPALMFCRRPCSSTL